MSAVVRDAAVCNLETYIDQSTADGLVLPLWCAPAPPPVSAAGKWEHTWTETTQAHRLSASLRAAGSGSVDDPQ